MTSSLTTGLTATLAATGTASAPGAAPGARDPLQAQQEARVRQARSALETLKQQSSSAADQRKAAARKKVDDLKARIQMMKMTMLADPKAAARMVAQLARELGAAVKAYGGAGGAMADLGLTGTATAPAASPATEARTDAAGAVQAEPSPETPDESGAAGEATDKAAGEKTPPADRKAIEAQQTQAADRARKAEGLRADSEFVATAKGLAADLKAMAKKAEADARRSGETGPDDRTARAALDALDSQVAEVGDSLTGGMMSLTV